MTKRVQKIQPRSRSSMKTARPRGGSKSPLKLKRGQCRICHCEWETCAAGCGWVDCTLTLCTVCCDYLHQLEHLFDEHGKAAIYRLAREVCSR